MRRYYFYRVLRPDGGEETHTAEMTNPQPMYDELREMIESHLDGGEMFHITIIASNGKRSSMFVDEMFNYKNLARNNLATALYRAAWLDSHPDVDPESLPFIAGVAVVFAEVV